MTADAEDEYVVAQANEPIEDGCFARPKLPARYSIWFWKSKERTGRFMTFHPRWWCRCDGYIPFLEKMKQPRLMGSNMQRQAVPLMLTESPIIGTRNGVQAASIPALSSFRAYRHVKLVDSDRIIIEDEEGTEHVAA